jgi:hypothetical protein
MVIKAAKKLEKCPGCGKEVSVKILGDEKQVLFNSDGSAHVCATVADLYPQHPIGQAVTGQTVVKYQLRGRQLPLYFDGGGCLSVSAAGTPLSIIYNNKEGAIQE